MIEHVKRWVDEAARRTPSYVDLTHQSECHDGSWAARVDAESSQRIGSVSIWDTGELDMQVIRRSDDFLVLNDHRRVNAPGDLTAALETFFETASYLEADDL